jgi:hypothetical protein
MEKYQVDQKSLESYEKGLDQFVITRLKPGMKGDILQSYLYPNERTVLVLEREEPLEITLDMQILASLYSWPNHISGFLPDDVEVLSGKYGISKEEIKEIIKKEKQILRMLKEVSDNC